MKKIKLADRDIEFFLSYNFQKTNPMRRRVFREAFLQNDKFSLDVCLKLKRGYEEKLENPKEEAENIENKLAIVNEIMKKQRSTKDKIRDFFSKTKK